MARKPEQVRPSQTIQEMYEAQPNAWIFTIAIIVAVMLLLAWSSTTLNNDNSTSIDGKAVALSIVHGLTHPNAQMLLDFSSAGVPYLLLETMCIAFLGTLVGAVLAIPFAFLGAVNIVPKPIALLFRTVVMAIRTIPTFVYGLMFIRVTGPGPFAGLLTMSVTSIGMISKMFIESIEDIDKGILESLDAMGCTTFQKIRYGIIPQISADFASILIYRFDMNLRDTTTLGLVGAGGIGAPLIFAMNGYKWDQAGAILCGLIVLILIIEWISNKLRNHLARGI
ncbi:MAG: phosphonate ABC transporter, permease protein PhnE [Spirochaetales bacterium]|jgi:phosphonate transport system permease protein|nr:phosphonate ABC transporter, permease protein PhnE [Spirochaetales bacterium]